MSQPSPQALARILAAPWHQRRNTGGAWGTAIVLALCFAAPVVLYAWSLFAAPGHQVETLRTSAGASFWIGVGSLLVVGWAMLVGNVLQQNHPTYARLVPHHAGQLRLALLVGWALASLAVAALPGFVFDAPLEWGCGAAAALATLAAALRWPLLWVAGVAAPFVVSAATRVFGAFEVMAVPQATWYEHRLLVTGLVVTAGTAVLVLAVRNGGAGHIAAYESRQRLRQAVLQPQQAGRGWGVPDGRCGWFLGLSVHGRPYTWWMTRLLANPRSAVMSRLFVGLGPANHWTTRLWQACWFLAVSGVVCAGVVLFAGRGMLAYVLPWLAFSVLTGMCTPALQAVPQLHQTRREQALLALLPGVPRGARLNRWLAWQMSVTFVVAAVAALVLAWSLGRLADAFRPGIFATATGGMVFGVAAVLLPQVAWQWRHWARLRGATGGSAQAPTIAPIVLGVGVMVLHVATGVGYLAAGVVLALLAVAWCAWRWVRMGTEPTAFPVARMS